MVKRWWHGRQRRSKCFVLRGALMEVLNRETCQEAKRQYVRRSRRKMAHLERQLTRYVSLKLQHVVHGIHTPPW